MGGQESKEIKALKIRATQYRPVKPSVSSSNQLFLTRRVCGDSRHCGVGRTWEVGRLSPTNTLMA